MQNEKSPPMITANRSAHYRYVCAKPPMRMSTWIYLSVLFGVFSGDVTAKEADDGNRFELEPLVVSARKREESDQKVPISTTVLSADKLNVSPLQSNADLARSAPNFNFVDLGGQSSNLANIRGVGSFSPVAPDDTSAVFYVDEVPLSVYSAAPNLIDIERVEVLRGPQGTLFGRNTQGGAVSILTKAPSFYDELSFSAEVGNNDYRSGEWIVNGVLIEDRLAGRLALGYSGQDGNIPNIVAGGEDGEINVGSARGSFLLEIDEVTTARLSLNYNHEDNTNPRFLLRSADNFPVSAVNPRTDIEFDSYGFNLIVDHEFDRLTLRSISAVQRNTSSQYLDLTDGLVFGDAFGLPASAFNLHGSDVQAIDFSETVYSQELRFASVNGEEIAWVAGVNLFRSEFENDNVGQSTVRSFLQMNGTQNNDITINSFAAFGEVTFLLNDRLKLTTGLRGSYEEKQAHYLFRGNGTPGVVALSEQGSSIDDSFITGRGILSYQWADDLMTYASIARGYVTGGFPAVSVNSPFGSTEPSFSASESWTYEVGFKWQSLDHRMRLNGALFFNDVKNGHLIVFDPSAALFTVGTLDYQSYGGELEATIQLTAGLEFTTGVGYTHAELVDVPVNDLSGANSHDDVPNVPELTGNVGLQYHHPVTVNSLSSGEFIARVNYQYVDKRAADVANNFELDDYGLINTKLGWQFNDMTFYVFANNLLDEHYEVWGQSFGAGTQTVRVGQSRLLGIGTSIQF